MAGAESAFWPAVGSDAVLHIRPLFFLHVLGLQVPVKLTSSRQREK